MKKVISINSTKEAALYFDHVLPFDAVTSIRINKSDANPQLNICIPWKDPELSQEILKSLLPANIDTIKIGAELTTWQALGAELVNRSNLLIYEKNTSLLLANFLNKTCDADIDFKLLSNNPSKTEVNAFFKKMNKYISDLGFTFSAAWGYEKSLNEIKKNEENMAFEICLQGLNLVDLENVSWKKIIEFRKDKNSLSALRDLRLFFQENFEGKNKDYIQDKILQTIETQEKAAKMWGFETIQKSLSVAFSQQSAVMSTGASLAASIGGAPLTAVAGAALAFPLGNIALEFSKIFIESHKHPGDRSTRYLTNLKKLSRKASK